MADLESIAKQGLIQSSMGLTPLIQAAMSKQAVGPNGVPAKQAMVSMGPGDLESPFAIASEEGPKLVSSFISKYPHLKNIREDLEGTALDHVMQIMESKEPIENFRNYFKQSFSKRLPDYVNKVLGKESHLEDLGGTGSVETDTPKVSLEPSVQPTQESNLISSESAPSQSEQMLNQADIKTPLLDMISKVGGSKYRDILSQLTQGVTEQAPKNASYAQLPRGTRMQDVNRSYNTLKDVAQQGIDQTSQLTQHQARIDKVMKTMPAAERQVAQQHLAGKSNLDGAKQLGLSYRKYNEVLNKIKPKLGL